VVRFTVSFDVDLHLDGSEISTNNKISFILAITSI